MNNVEVTLLIIDLKAHILCQEMLILCINLIFDKFIKFSLNICFNSQFHDPSRVYVNRKNFDEI